MMFMRKAFTIIELLVVIAIIAVLAAILFPVFARAKQSGMQTAALSNMSQIGKAYLLYLDDADGKLLPSTNYGIPESEPERLWTNNLLVFTKNKELFVAPGSEGIFASTWEQRGKMTVGYNVSTALDRSKGCNDEQTELAGCVAFKEVTSLDKSDSSNMALFACTPGGPSDKMYRGYEFSPYNGVPVPENPRLTPPLVSDRDLVKELSATLPAELLRPVEARYMSTGKDDGSTPIMFGDGHAKAYTAKEIMGNSGKIIWRLR
jgi:prepilin-type N-terminal cleavage/methylation domain-containing protein